MLHVHFFLVGGNAALDINVINQLQETFNQTIYNTKMTSAAECRAQGISFLTPLWPSPSLAG